MVHLLEKSVIRQTILSFATNLNRGQFCEFFCNILLKIQGQICAAESLPPLKKNIDKILLRQICKRRSLKPLKCDYLVKDLQIVMLGRDP